MKFGYIFPFLIQLRINKNLEVFKTLYANYLYSWINLFQNPYILNRNSVAISSCQGV